MNRPKIIGITGVAGAGKDSVRAILEEHGFNGMAFADPIRDMIRMLIAGAGIDEAYIDSRELKESIIPELGVSYRHMAQTLGTEWGRSLQSDFWLRLAGAYMADVSECFQDSRFVISDVRFINEAKWVWDRGGVIWRVVRPGVPSVRRHVSEFESCQIEADKTLFNIGTIEDLRDAISEALEVAQ